MQESTLSRFTGILMFFLSLVVIVCGCIPTLRQKAPTAAFPVMNEKMFLYPVIDSSCLELFEGWPSDESLQKILRRHFQKLDNALLVEFRRCEKYGLYEMVEDSMRSSVRITFVVGRFLMKKDVLTFPVRMTARRFIDKAERSFPIEAVGMYRSKSRPKSAAHYLDILLADFRRHFPYRKVTGVFYPQYGIR